MTRFRDRLVADWGTIAKFWSVRINAAGVLLLPLLQMVPVMPEPVQALLPLKVRAITAGVYCMIAIAARVWPQKKLNG